MTTLRIAVPNKGTLSQSSTDILRESGYRQRQDSKELALVDTENDVEFFYLRPRDIALYVGEGTLDVGITGRDLLLDSGAKAEEVLGLGFGRSTFRFAGPIGRYTELTQLQGTRIATSYVGIVRQFLTEHGIDATVNRLDGAVESSIQLGVADVIADVVETGTTLHKAGLETFGEAIPEARVAEAVAVTPGIESPTVSPLHREGWVAVRAMVPRSTAQRVMDELWNIGARGILVTDIHACRL
jgi:ATP phosphoribosyltransferase